VRYVGRFAPSPTGPLHLGSLTTAVASYLHARQADGEWLLRIEDIDPPREVPGARDAILRSLEALELHWDRSVLLQSTRTARYRDVAHALLRRGLAFRCSCTRRQIRARGGAGGRYPGTCRERSKHRGATGVRVRVEPGACSVDDLLQGVVCSDVCALHGDYLIYRRDGLPAYHLAVVVDDAEAGVTCVVRGSDLLQSTPVHAHLQRLLGYATPAYYHVPVLTHADGQKLSKQSGAAPIDTSRPGDLAARVLELLGLHPPAELQGAQAGEYWRWASAHWRIQNLRGCREFALK
jgi:glutamyl-Q tRNA(Asp) synthetase